MQRLPRADLEHRGPPCHPAEAHRRTSRLPSVDLQQPALGRKPLGTPERMARGGDPLREDRPILPRRPLPRRYIRLAQELTGLETPVFLTGFSSPLQSTPKTATLFPPRRRLRKEIASKL